MARKATRSSKTGTRSASKSRTAAKSPPSRAASKSSAASKRSTARKTSSRSVPARRAQKGSREPKNLGDLFLETLKDIYHAEKQILKALPKMAKAAQSGELRDAFLTHAGQTRGQVERIEKIFEMSGKRPQAKPCHAIMGLVEEGNEVMQEFKGSDVLDAGLLAGAQAVEHYEISRYGTLKAWALQHGMNDVAALLDETLNEEKETDALLTKIAESSVNHEGEEAYREAA